MFHPELDPAWELLVLEEVLENGCVATLNRTCKVVRAGIVVQFHILTKKEFGVRSGTSLDTIDSIQEKNTVTR